MSAPTPANDPFASARLGPVELRNRIVKAATFEGMMAEGFEFVAMGRALLREPDLVEKVRTGASRDSLCVHCNKCIPTIYRGTHCVLAT